MAERVPYTCQALSSEETSSREIQMHLSWSWPWRHKLEVPRSEEAKPGQSLSHNSTLT